MKIGTSLFLIHVASLSLGVAAQLRGGADKERGTTNRQLAFNDTMELVEVIIGLEKDDGDGVFTEMSNTLFVQGNTINLDKVLPEIKAGVTKVHPSVSGPCPLSCYFP